MATAGPGPGSELGAGRGPSPTEDEAKCAACLVAQPGARPPCGHPACPLCLARRHSGSEERLRRRSDPERSSSRPDRRDCDSRREFFVSPAFIPKSSDILSGPVGKHKLLLSEDRDEFRRKNTLICKDESGSIRHNKPGVLSDSENEEPIGKRIKNISAFIRKTKTSSAFTCGCQRSRSCTDSVEDKGGKMKVTTQPNAMDQPVKRNMEDSNNRDWVGLYDHLQPSSCIHSSPGQQLGCETKQETQHHVVGISHSYTAGILLSSENSRSVSAPITAPDRRFTWRAVVTTSSSSTPLVLPPSRSEHSISPDSNDSISEELNHFKPIVCSPCTPPKRLPDGRLMEPTIVKSTPRNLTRGLQKATSYEASPAVLQKWRQIELDRQSLKVNSKATLTSPVTELHKTSGAEDATKTHQSSAGDGVMSINKRRLLFDPLAGDVDSFQKQSVKIRVPAIRYSNEETFRGSSDFEPTVGAPESCSGGAVFSQKQSFSPYTKNSGFQSCKSVPKDSQSPKKESDSSIHNQFTSKRGKKRKQKTKHLDSDRDSELKRRLAVSQEAFDERYTSQIQQERQDRALALKLQRQFDLENQSVNRRRSPNKYFLRSWMSNQNRRRRGLRRSRRINKKH